MGYSKHAFIFFPPSLSQNNILKWKEYFFVTHQALPRCMRLSTKETKTSYPVDMTELLLQGHAQTHMINCTAYATEISFTVTWRQKKTAQLWDDVRFSDPFVRSAQLWESAPFVGLTLFVSLKYIEPKYCFIWNHCIALWNLLHLGKMHTFCMMLFFIFAWLL